MIILITVLQVKHLKNTNTKLINIAENIISEIELRSSYLSYKYSILNLISICTILTLVFLSLQILQADKINFNFISAVLFAKAFLNFLEKLLKILGFLLKNKRTRQKTAQKLNYSAVQKTVREERFFLIFLK